MRPRLSFKELRELGSDLNAETSKLKDELIAVVTKHAGIASQIAAEDAPIFTGGGAGSIKPRGAAVEQSGAGIRVRDIVRTGRVSMVVHELGRGIGKKPPPSRVLLRWVRLMVRRGKIKIDSGRTEKQVAFLIGRAIKSRGQDAPEGQKFMERAGISVEPGFGADVDRVVREFRDRVHRG